MVQTHGTVGSMSSSSSFDSFDASILGTPTSSRSSASSYDADALASPSAQSTTWRNKADDSEHDHVRLFDDDTFQPNTPCIQSGMFESPTREVKHDSTLKWASHQKNLSFGKRPKPDLRVDLSNIPPAFQVPTLQIPSAPRIGALPTPSPSIASISPLTPRPGLQSRFSDDSPKSVDLVSKSGSGATLAPGSPTLHQPMTPRTVDALNCFGICGASATSTLMSRGRSRDKPTSPSHLRTAMPRSPLSMPPSGPCNSNTSSLHMSNLASPTDRNEDMYEENAGQKARRLFHTLLPGDKTKLTTLLQTPDETDLATGETRSWEDERSYTHNPYFGAIEARS